MAKNILGIDIGHSQLKLALLNGSNIKKIAYATIPENLVRGGRVVSIEAMAEFIKETCKKNDISARCVSIALPDSLVYERQVNLPKMTREQLLVNIPYEFKVYISDELQNYNFDYSMITPIEELKKPETTSMDLLAFAVSKELVDEYKLMIRKAGMKLISVIPEACAFQSLIRVAKLKQKEYCILDLGYQSTRLMMFKGDSHRVTKELEIGLRDIDQVIGDHYNIDIHLAHTYFLKNHDNCQDKDYCKEIYHSISVELQRVIKFYQFSNRDSELEDMWIVGCGTVCNSLVEEINKNNDLTLHNSNEFVDGEMDKAYLYAEVIGVALGGLE